MVIDPMLYPQRGMKTLIEEEIGILREFHS